MIKQSKEDKSQMRLGATIIFDYALKGVCRYKVRIGQDKLL